MTETFLQIVIVSRLAAESAGVILYAELKESELVEAANDPRTLAETIIDTSGVARFFPSGTWPTKEFSVNLTHRKNRTIISDDYLVETADGRKIWVRAG